METKKVKIELSKGEIQEKEWKSLPSANIFTLMPRQQPELAQYIHKMTWHAKARELDIAITETPDLGVCRWMEYIHQRQKAIKEGPFVDLEQDALILRMYNSRCHELARLKFKNLNIKNHQCEFNDSNTGAPLIHFLVVEYQECETMPLERGELPPATNELVDKEWNRVEA